MRLDDGKIARVLHERTYLVREGEDDELLPWGGRTTVEIFADEKAVEPLAVGVAECSEFDNYNRKIGRNIALGRALKQIRVKGES